VPADDPYEFNEDWYRATYADVAAAVAAGLYASGRDHYARHGRGEGRFPCAEAEDDKLMARGIYADAGDGAPSEEARRQRVGDVWSEDSEQKPGWYWMAHPMVRARLNTLASGDPEQDTYDRLATVLRQRGVALPIGRAVSLGCGFGSLERTLAGRGIVREIDAYDIAPGAIAEARRLAEEAGLAGLRYHLGDLEAIEFPPGEVDVVFAHSCVHHIERLDELFAAVSAMLKPGGIFHVNEFVGPTRFQWTDGQITEVNRFLRALPPRLRRLPSGQPRPLQGRATVAAMIAADPSEAIRSADIVPVLRRHFDILEIAELGGALLHLGLADIAQNFDPDSPADRATLEAFFAAEDGAMRDGLVASDFAVITAVARPDPARPPDRQEPPARTGSFLKWLSSRLR
jgi:SAM-dependent methyltransferase